MFTGGWAIRSDLKLLQWTTTNIALRLLRSSYNTHDRYCGNFHRASALFKNVSTFYYNLKLSLMPDTATRTSQTCYSMLPYINGNAYFENLVDYSLPNDFSRSPTLGGIPHGIASSRAKFLTVVCKNHQSATNSATFVRHTYLFSGHCPSLFISFVYFKAVSHFVSTLTDLSEPSCKMSSLGC